MLIDTINIHKDLIDRCRQEDRFAQQEVYRLYSKAMLNTAFRILANRGEAEDVLQDSFVIAFTKMHQYRAEASFGAWLKKIVVNKSLNILKKRKNSVLHLTDELPEIEDEQTQDFAEEKMTIQSVKEAVEHLPDGFRSVLTLYVFEGYDHTEIADILGISESTSKSQYNRAKKKIREFLTKEVKYG